MRGMMRNERKNVTAALLLAATILAATILAAPVHARNIEPSRGVRNDGAGRSWVVRVLGWFGLPTGLGSIWEASSANIDPNGKPTNHSGENGGASATSDSSAYIDPNG
jgi:hypothetical protein